MSREPQGDLKMFVPPYAALLHAIGASPASLDLATEVTVPVSLFKHLLKIAVAESDFNEASYLAANPDVAAAIRSGSTAGSPKEHYVNYGYFEARRGAVPLVDEIWYRNANPDVAAAIRAGQLASGQEHFDVVGAEEFRIPNEASETQVLIWKKSVGKTI
jgi:hypothetical protein